MHKDDHIFNYVGMESIDETIEKIKESGGEIIKPKSPIPGVGYYVFIKDFSHL